jgi:hypothetical protein
MIAVVTAGSRPASDEPLFELTQGGYKAMLAINGKPMIQWVLDALNHAQSVSQIVVVGLPLYSNLNCDRPLTHVEDHGGLVENVCAGLREAGRLMPGESHSLLLSCDIPTITGEMVDWVAAQIGTNPVDIIYPVISRKVMEDRFPGSKRTYLHLKDIEVCGGDVMAVRNRIASEDNPLWRRIVDARKNPLRQAALFGYDTLFMVALRQYTLEEAGRSISKRMGIQGRPVLSPFADIGMDIDKPQQLQLVLSDMARHPVV